MMDIAKLSQTRACLYFLFVVLKVKHLSGFAFCTSLIHSGVPEQILEWFPLGLGLAMRIILFSWSFIYAIRKLIKCVKYSTVV